VDTKIMKSKCERVAPLSPEHQHMGLTGSELLGALATEGATNLTEKFNMMLFAGYKTYMVAVAIMLLAVMKYMGMEVPAEVWLVLNALGLGFLRAGVEEAK
jgi:hypothetical protein